MSETARQVRCSTHGLQDETLVCEHIIGSMHSGVPVAPTSHGPPLKGEP